ncbi:hypothetical protein EXIGLDRAFT_489863 [Exidia glandulosa HHB12029]|uniref:Uncharacterized protein n=1 Tax=Exidia glandulosa HHB12029 TaxID=1314781 RepID=A0A166NCQ5_EXIGL|nr:hypothetical protein EXIGLDRAFT_489863 [Exidia glandulosa HHB12029]
MSTRALERSRSAFNPRLRPGDSSLRPRELWAAHLSSSSTCNCRRRWGDCSQYLRQVSSAHLSRSSTYQTYVPAADSSERWTDRRGRLCIAHDGHKNLYQLDAREITKPKARVLVHTMQIQNHNIFNNTFRRSGGLHMVRYFGVGRRECLHSRRFDVARLNDRLSLRSSRGRVRRRRARSDDHRIRHANSRTRASRAVSGTQSFLTCCLPPRFSRLLRVSFRPYDVDALEVPRQMRGA